MGNSKTSKNSKTKKTKDEKIGIDKDNTSKTSKKTENSEKKPKDSTSKASKKTLNSEKTLDDIDNELEEVIDEAKSMDKNKKKENHKNTYIPTKKPRKNSKD